MSRVPQIRPTLTVVVHTERVRLAAAHAARLAGAEPGFAPITARFAGLEAGRGAAALLVHDFLPDAAGSVERLSAAADAGCRFSVFALLSPPATPVLDLLCHIPRRFVLSGMAVAGEEDEHRLAARLRAAAERGGRLPILEVVVPAWRLGPELARVAQRELDAARPHTTLSGLLRDARVGRKAFVELAREAGFTPPLRFLHALRVLEAAELLRAGSSLLHAVEVMGMGSPDTLRRQFRAVAGLPPRAASAVPLADLALRCAPAARA
ncbi:MAG TPA: hypothetical protein VFJ16_32585 [Longimicrobium sp.]|nr:hypothetical protein [Longimicrobium sp.]